ncbi:MAG: hypothetical protein J1F09_01540 [Oscillospiraceae bacterium]|nr:hypothetical protein [Oscillospiraceae bacterium]
MSSDNNRESRLICESCGGILEVDPTKTIARCPFCGTCYSVSGLLNESDEVKIAKIQFQAYRDVELGRQQVDILKEKNEAERLRQQSERDKRQEQMERAKAFRNGDVGKVLVILAIIGLFHFIFYFTIKNIWGCFLAVAMIILLFFSFVLGYIGKRLYIIPAILGVALLIPLWTTCINTTDCMPKFYGLN